MEVGEGKATCDAGPRRLPCATPATSNPTTRDLIVSPTELPLKLLHRVCAYHCCVSVRRKKFVVVVVVGSHLPATKKRKTDCIIID